MRRFVLALPFLAVPLAVAACGGSKSATPTTVTLPEDPTAAVRGAAAKTADTGSEHVAIVGRTVGGQTVTFKGAGDFDTKARVGSLNADFSSSGLNGAIDEVSSGTLVYVKSELLGAFLPAGKTWMKVDLAKAGKGLGALTTLVPQDPLKALSQLRSLRSVTRVGAVQLGGKPTTHYRGRIDLSVLTGTTMTGTGRYDVWIGADGYVHRVTAVVATGGTTSTVTTDLSAFGEPVKVTVPKAADTFDATNAKIPGLGG